MIGTAAALEDACWQAQDMINQMSRGWREGQSVNLSGGAVDKPPPLIQKKDQLSQSRHSIQSKLTRLYFEELSKVPHATPDSVLVDEYARTSQ